MAIRQLRSRLFAMMLCGTVLVYCGWPVHTHATSYGYGMGTALSSAQLSSNVFVAPLIPKTVWNYTGTFYTFPTLHSGDTISLRIGFNKLLQVGEVSGAADTNEMIYWSFQGSGVLSSDQALPYTWSFEQVSGALLFTNFSGTGVLRKLPDGTIQGVINASQTFAMSNLTSSAFSFGGIELTLTIPLISSGWTPASFHISVAGNSVSIYPPEQKPLLTAHGHPVLLSWPTNAVGFGLATTTNLDAGTVWQNWSVAPARIGTNYVVTNAFADSMRLFRLSDWPQHQCASYLRQIGLAFRMWLDDHDERYPFQVSTNLGGTRELRAIGSDGFDTNAYVHFRAISNELEIATLLVCPGDFQRTSATNFESLRPENVTYQIRTGDTVSLTNPDEVMVVCPIDGNTLFCSGQVLEGASR